MDSEHTDLSVEELIHRLQNADPLVRVHAATLLATLAEKALPAVPTLIGLLKADQAQDRKLAAWTLGEIGPAAEEAVPALLDAVNDENRSVFDMAFWALEQIDLVPAANEAA